jgi:glycosyltransferase involved in cell wall biosynthesis
MGTNNPMASVAAPQFSIVCPVFNSEKWVQRTLDTVLKQTFSSLELIIIDDGSVDNTPSFVAEYLQRRRPGFRWIILANEHRGPGAARNVGIRAAKGEWIAFLDSDDLWAPQKLKRVAQAISASPNANFICHHEEMHKLSGQRITLEYASHYNANCHLSVQLYHRNLFSTSAVVCQRSTLLKHGLFDESLMSAQDYELWLRLSPHLRIIFVEETLGVYVERRGNITSKNWSKRIKNELSLAFRYRRVVSNRGVLIRILRIMTSYAKQGLLFFVQHLRF